MRTIPRRIRADLLCVNRALVAWCSVW